MKTCNIMEYVHDLKKFVETGKYYALAEPVPVYYNGEVYNVSFLSLDTDEDDIFLSENDWDENGANDVICITDLNGEDASKVFESVICQEIDNGWEWLDHAHDVLNERFPSMDDAILDDFACEYWQNCKTDEWNVRQFIKQTKEVKL